MMLVGMTGPIKIRPKPNKAYVSSLQPGTCAGDIAMLLREGPMYLRDMLPLLKRDRRSVSPVIGNMRKNKQIYMIGGTNGRWGKWALTEEVLEWFNSDKGAPDAVDLP